MKNKLYFAFLICLVVLFATLSYASATDIRMAEFNLPDGYIELTGDIDKSDISSVNLGEKKLTVSGTKSAGKCSNCVYMLVDVSGSMSQSAFNNLKPSLISFAKRFGSDDKFVLMTFGTSVKTILSGGESDSKIESAFNSIVCNEPKTSFYSALDKAFDGAVKQKNYDRRFIIIVSDGENYDKGNSSQDDVVDKYATHRVPIYGLCQSNSSASNSDGFGYIVRKSGGKFFMYSADDASQKFSQLEKSEKNITYVTMKSPTRKSLGKTDITINVNGQKITQSVVVNAKQDKTKPSVKSVKYDNDAKCFVVKFSESVQGADKISSYEIKPDKKDKEIKITSVKYKNKKAYIYTDETVYSGKYEIKFSGITDDSDNENKLSKGSFKTEITATPIAYKILIIVGICAVPVLFLLAIYIILLRLKAKKKVKKIKDIFVEQVEETEEEKIIISQKKGISVVFYIEGGDGVNHRVNYNLVSSVIFGRNEAADIIVDDRFISNQHFVIERVDNGMVCQDLGSMNGTYVNGARIASRTFLNPNSKITAGRSRITVDYKL